MFSQSDCVECNSTPHLEIQGLLGHAKTKWVISFYGVTNAHLAEEL